MNRTTNLNHSRLIVDETLWDSMAGTYVYNVDCCCRYVLIREHTYPFLAAATHAFLVYSGLKHLNTFFFLYIYGIEDVNT